MNSIVTILMLRLFKFCQCDKELTSKIWFSDDMEKDTEFLDRLIKKEKTQIITNIVSDRGNITMGTTSDK